jgi:hypothetical protein
MGASGDDRAYAEVSGRVGMDQAWNKSKLAIFY